jgi:hypothetical protein
MLEAQVFIPMRQVVSDRRIVLARHRSSVVLVVPSAAAGVAQPSAAGVRAAGELWSRVR